MPEKKEISAATWEQIAADIERGGYVAVKTNSPNTPSDFTRENLYRFAEEYDFALVFIPRYNWALVAVTIDEIITYILRRDHGRIIELEKALGLLKPRVPEEVQVVAPDEV